MSFSDQIFQEIEQTLSQKGLLSEKAEASFLEKQSKKNLQKSKAATTLQSSEPSHSNGFEVSISPDLYFATLSISKITDHLDEQLIHLELDRLGVNHGIDFKKIHDLVAQYNVDQKPVSYEKIAFGKKVIEASTPHIKYYFENLNLVESESDTKNFWDQFRLNYVKKDRIIAEKFGSFGGEDGISVTSEIIRCLPKTHIELIAGQNTILKNNQIISLIDGRPKLVENCVHVIPKKTIEQHFDFQQEIIRFDGDLEILGDIQANNNISASGNIFVLGNVNDSILSANECIIINGKFSGEHEGLCKATKNIYIDDSYYGTIESDENIFIRENLIHTNVYSLKSLICSGVNSNVYGGVLQIGADLITLNLGAKNDRSTTIFMGNQKLLSKKIKKLETESIEIQDQIDTISDAISKIQTNFSSDSKNQKNIENLNLLDLLINGIRSIQQRQMQILSEEQNLEFTLNQNTNHIIKVKGDIYPNIQIQMEKVVKKTTDRFKNVEISFNREVNQIQMTQLNPDNKPKKFLDYFKLFK
ncbi:MAG: DUF342 domain-containing protein [Candidatus Cloacimonetes bacterium]|nr:DUF342 domain-containing protein [Candidatus Cloacimonadota bacterium]